MCQLLGFAQESRMCSRDVCVEFCGTSLGRCRSVRLVELWGEVVAWE